MALEVKPELNGVHGVTFSPFRTPNQNVILSKHLSCRCKSSFHPKTGAVWMAPWTVQVIHDCNGESQHNKGGGSDTTNLHTYYFSFWKLYLTKCGPRNVLGHGGRGGRGVI